MQRTKTLSFKLVVLLLITCLIIPLLPDVTARATDFEERFYDFEDGTSTGWYRPWNGELSVSSEKAYAGSKSLKITGRQNSWDSPALNMYNIIKQGGAGVYTIHMAVLVDNLVDGGEYGHLLIRGNQENSFITLRSNGNYYYKLTSTVKLVENEWYYFTGSFIVANSDISATSGLFNLCFDFITPTENQNIYIDNVRIIQSASHTEALTVTPSQTTLYVGNRLVLDLNRYNNLTFTSSNPSVATVDGNGVVFAVATGRTTITVNYNNTETAECVVDVKSVEDGVYFVKNIETKEYMQVQDSRENSNVEIGAYIGDYTQQWYFEYVTAGYYKIISEESGLALTVNNDSVENEALIQKQYVEGNNKQQWYVDRETDGSCKIWPRSSASTDKDLCLAAGTLNTEQKVFTNDTNNNDKWKLSIGVRDPYKLLAYDDEICNRALYFDEVSSMIDVELDGFIYTNYYSALTKMQMKNLLCDSEIFIVHTHGYQEGIYIGEDSWLLMDDLDDFNLKTLRFALLLTCKTSENFSYTHIIRNEPVNIVEKMKCQGAETVVGFNKVTYVDDCNKFAVDFCELAIEMGYNVEQAIERIDYSEYYQNMNNIKNIAGNEELVLNY